MPQARILAVDLPDCAEQRAQMTLSLVVGLVIVVACGMGYVLLSRLPAASLAPDPERVRDGLHRLTKDPQSLPSLCVVYHDLHGFHGGLSLSIWGNGKISQQAVRTPVGIPKEQVSHEDLLGLVALLCEVEAWEQRVPDAMPIPDESRALLRISVGDSHSVIWERYNDMAAAQRMIRVRERMKAIAWRAESFTATSA